MEGNNRQIILGSARKRMTWEMIRKPCSPESFIVRPGAKFRPSMPAQPENMFTMRVRAGEYAL